jgi:hypothetical protein
MQVFDSVPHSCGRTLHVWRDLLWIHASHCWILLITVLSGFSGKHVWIQLLSEIRIGLDNNKTYPITTAQPINKPHHQLAMHTKMTKLI